ncbi:sensor domain-containing diguanylate cyclase [Vibrio penaeicida]|uniref:diguanylate cyclase n=1 Tax=Vibrio penaeicida TaxID=104609 RepID=A0AAV5NRQ4_9VIBR|nr:sensor domain-containing diguanylate cyclase [Vibrio penaeicida]RTZ19382.1 sensor domain-containing diguanylate cyclase [Vibrio penaeicida]GLQ73004.1 sensor domain-containing diguanylate cyclase [Vibrio penaeicida]
MPLNNQRHNQPKGSFLPWLTFGVIAFVTLLFVYLAALSQQNHTFRLFDNLAERQSQMLKVLVEKDIDFIGAAANFFHSVESEDWGQFPVFAEEIIKDSSSLIGLQWMPRVKEENLADHLNHLRKLNPDVKLHTVPKDQPKTFGFILPKGEDAYIVSDIYPRSEQNKKLIGFYSSRERFRVILKDIVKTGDSNISDKIRLLQDGEDKTLPKTGMLAYHPVFSHEDQSLLGVMVGVVRTTRYFEDLMLRTAAEQELVIQVKDIGFDADDDPILFESAGWAETEGLKIRKTIRLQNREWILKFRLMSPMTANDKWTLASIALCGLVVASLAAFVVNLISREKYRLAQKVEEQTSELRYLVDHDTLTGVYNRRAFNQMFATVMEKNAPFSLVGFDIDKFKVINDKYGHAAGDAALMHVSTIISEELNDGDFFARVGGDEFCILTYDTNEDILSAYVSRLIRRVSCSPVKFGRLSIDITLSAGAKPRAGESSEELMRTVDALMYSSKQAGRNCVSVGNCA